MPTKNTEPHTHRPPVVVIMGHIDHGKSSLLDYIRKTNVVATEVGGITQRLSAYEVVRRAEDGAERSITFIDTPGHEAFRAMRSRGAGVADIAVLVISAEEGVKPQTLEAHASIVESNIPFVVAVTKIDKPNANVERTKASLLEHGIYLEGMGGTVPVAAVSSKTGAGIPELLDLILLVADLADLTLDAAASASGVVIESHLDAKKGISATLIVKSGTLAAGSCIVTGSSWSPVRIMENFLGAGIRTAGPSTPVRIIGWSSLPEVGSVFEVAATKRDAEARAQAYAQAAKKGAVADESTGDRAEFPVVVKANSLGSLEAVLHELGKIPSDRVRLRILASGVGTISENDVKRAGTNNQPAVFGFSVRADGPATDLAERLGVGIETFDIIYKLAERVAELTLARTPKVATEEVTGKAKVLKVFGAMRDKQVAGGRIEEGALAPGNLCHIVRRGERIGRAKILGLQQQKVAVARVESGEFGMEAQSKLEIAPGDSIECFVVVEK